MIRTNFHPMSKADPDLMPTATKKTTTPPAPVEDTTSLSSFDSEKAVREFSGRTGMELGTLLGAMVGQLEFALSQAYPDVRENALRVVLKAAERAIALSRNLRFFSAHAETAHRPIDVSQVLINTIDILDRELSSQTIHPSVAAEAGSFAMVDTATMRQTLLNLTQFVASRMPQGGRLLITLRQNAKTLDISLTDNRSEWKPPSNSLGIEDVDASYLGFAVAKCLAEAMGGGLRVSVAPRLGTTFTLRLPRYQFEGAPPVYRDKRRARRIQVRMPAEVLIPGVSSFKTEIRVLSKLGAFLKIEDATLLGKLTPHTRIALKINYFPKESIEIPRVRVANSIPQGHLTGVGIEFEEVGYKARRILSGILKGHSS